MSKRERHHFLAVFLTGSVSFLLVLCLLPTKPNLLLNLGSDVSYFLYLSFGLCAWVFPLVFFYIARLRYRDENLSKSGLKLVGLILSVFSICALFRVIAPDAEMREGVKWGGKLGEWIGTPLEPVLGSFGTVVICVLVLVLSMWFLETEEHLIKGLQGVLEGFTRGGVWFKEHGFSALAALFEGTEKAIKNWMARRDEKKVADEARKKLGDEGKVFTSAPPPIEKPTVSSRVSPPAAKVEKRSKPSKALFTGEAEPFDKLRAGPESIEGPSGSLGAGPEPNEDDGDDMVAMAEAEAKPPAEHMTVRQKMEAANIEMADEEEVDSTRDARSPQEKEEVKPPRVIREWKLPTYHVLKTADDAGDKVTADFEGISRTLKETLNSFGVDATVVGINPGPTVTQYEVQPASGVKITSIASLADDLALALKCGQVRVVAPIPGKATVGIEVPNIKGRVVTLKELITQEEFLSASKKLSVALGKDITGETFIASLKEMPHVIIAGSTGSGKSVCVNTLIASLIFKYTPEEMRLVLVDPKRVEMTVYQGLPHLALPVMNDSKEAHLALKWLVREMEERYTQLAKMGARDIDSFNDKVAVKREAGNTDVYPMYYIVVLVDELADLMMVGKDQVEESITRLAQMARAVGIHLVLATQRPSVEVITGIIKANFPSRIAFQVASKVDSRTILDMNGAEALLGRGDMLYLPPGAPKPSRLQGAFVTLEEIERLVDFWKAQGGPSYSADLTASKHKDLVTEDSQDELYDEAVQIVVRAKQASTSFLQRRLKVGYSRAARLLDDMELRGIVGPADANKPRKILMPGLASGEPLDDEEAFDENQN